jgi:hypothetical protein
MPFAERVEECRERLAATPRALLLARRFIPDESWTKATTEGTRYVGVFREYEPDLAAVLEHQHVLMLGEPRAGKSTTAQAVIYHVIHLMANDKNAKIVLTSRPAYAARYPDTLPTGLTAYHLLDFDEMDIKAYAGQTRC